MQRIVYGVLAMIVALGLGFGIGWHAKGVSVTAADAKQEKAVTTAVITNVKHQADVQHADQVAEQGKSIALGIDKLGITKTSQGIQSEIDRATFTFPTPNIVIATPAVSISCPDDPVGSDEFARLYAQAAAGRATEATSTTTTSGVH